MHILKTQGKEMKEGNEGGTGVYNSNNHNNNDIYLYCLPHEVMYS
ncbi:hypothetical protein [Candidatus Nitrosocosmicus sp. T]